MKRLFCNIISGFVFILFISSCTEDIEISSLTPDEELQAPVDPTVPDDLKDGYTISFTLNLSPYSSGESYGLSRAATPGYQMEIDNFIDLEKVRILFFTCDVEKNPDGSFKVDNTGTKDHFLFESRSRWVAEIENADISDARWQVTAPVYKYGNNDDYDWDKIRWALQNKPFKIAVLVNRPDDMTFGDFDDMFGKEVTFKTDRGPNWNHTNAWYPPEIREENEKNQGDDVYRGGQTFTINDLHHCQWDPVYSSKNNDYGVYDFIMKNPKKGTKGSLEVPKDGDVGNWNMMGALSYWTIKEQRDADDNAKTTYYFLPSKKQGIPMYGVQVFDPIPSSWKEGTPFNVSYHTGDYFSKNIDLLRSLVKLELRIPKDIKINGEYITIRKPMLKYSNVMARCEPLDVATPTNEIWSKDHSDCEWKYLMQYGPLIRSSITLSNLDAFVDRMLWFYGAWQEWWTFNGKYTKGEAKFTNYSNKMSIPTNVFPHIYNPVVQRNEFARIDDCLVEDPDYWYYVVYTGERNINDPTKFTADNFTPSKTYVAYFQFNTEQNDKLYNIFVTDYGKNGDETRIANSLIYLTTEEEKQEKYITAMGESDKQSDWNWPLLRNHSYIFTVNSLGDYKDPGGINVTVISSERRTAPTFTFE